MEKQPGVLKGCGSRRAMNLAMEEGITSSRRACAGCGMEEEG